MSKYRIKIRASTLREISGGASYAVEVVANCLDILHFEGLIPELSDAGAYMEWSPRGLWIQTDEQSEDQLLRLHMRLLKVMEHALLRYCCDELARPTSLDDIEVSEELPCTTPGEWCARHGVWGGCMITVSWQSPLPAQIR